MAPKIDSLIIQNAICVFGSGDARDEYNFITRARVQAAYRLVKEGRLNNPVVAFFGCHRPSMVHTKLSEAETMEAYWRTLCEADYPGRTPANDSEPEKSLGYTPMVTQVPVVLHRSPKINSISTTCKEIIDEYFAQNDTVHLVINWPYSLRTYYLFYRQAKRAGLVWEKARERVHLVTCGGTLAPEFYHHPLSAFPNWLRNVLGMEVLRWINAFYDPFSERKAPKPEQDGETKA